MECAAPHEFKHTTLKVQPESFVRFSYKGGVKRPVYTPKRVGVTLLDEKPGFTGVYIRDEKGGLWPARTVSRKPKKHHDTVCRSWLSGVGENEDKRHAVKNRRAKSGS